MTRDPRHGLSIIVLHTIMKSERICPHVMSEHHGGVVVNEGAEGTPLSMIMKTQYKLLKPTSNQRPHQKSNMANMHTNGVKWLKGASLPKVGMSHPRGA
jgi:hypothetical protein